MLKYSKEYIELNQDQKNQTYDFSIVSEFQKLEPNSSIKKVCDGLGITEVINENGECFVRAYGEAVPFISLEKNLKKDSSLSFVISGLVILFVCILFAYLFIQFVSKENVGVYGDMFGGLNTLFSGLAFAGIIYTISLQKRELRLQREELKATRGEFKIQNETLRTQKFETTFFNLIANHQNTKNSFLYEEYSGDLAVANLLKNLTKMLYGANDSICSSKVPVNYTDFLPYQFEKLKEASLILLEDCLLILNFIEESKFADNLYHRILRNTLTNDEKLLLGWYLRNYKTKIRHNLIEFYSEVYDYKFGVINSETEYPPELYLKSFTFLASKMSLVSKLNENQNQAYIHNLSKNDVEIISISLIDEAHQIVSSQKLNHILGNKKQVNFNLFANYFSPIPAENREGEFEVQIEIKSKFHYFIHYPLSITSISIQKGWADLEVSFNV